MQGFGVRVKQELNVLGKMQKDLGTHLNVSKSTLSEWLNDKNEPPMSVIVEIAKFLEVSTDYLLDIEK